MTYEGTVSVVQITGYKTVEKDKVGETTYIADVGRRAVEHLRAMFSHIKDKSS